MVRRRDADYRNAYELALLRSAAMYLPNFLDGFDRLVAFDAETTGKRTPDAEFIGFFYAKVRKATRPGFAVQA